MKPDKVPMRWPVEWKDPNKLELIKGTPINCLVGAQPPPFPLGDIEFLALDAAGPPADVTLREGAWPSVQASNAGGDSAEAGPTGAPWVESNASVIRLARALEPGKKVWLTYPPPAKTEVVGFADFARPVAEAAVYGAHWVISLHDSLRTGIENGSAPALDGWKRMVRVLEFAREHAEWTAWKPVAALAVVSDFEGDGEFLGGEFLNLAERRNLAYRVVPEQTAAEASFDEQKAVLYIGSHLPVGAVKQRLDAFATSGGLLILPSQPPGVGEPVETKYGYQIFRRGRGRIASPIEEWYDPYVLAGEVQLLLSHRQDVVRIWNGGLMNSYLVASADKRKAVAQVVEYARPRRQYKDVTLGFSAEYKTAKVYTLDGVETVEPLKSRLGVEVPLPPFALYAAVELGV